MGARATEVYISLGSPPSDASSGAHLTGTSKGEG